MKKKVFFGEMLSQTFVTWKMKFRLFLEGQIGRLDCNMQSANFYWKSQQQLMNPSSCAQTSFRDVPFPREAKEIGDVCAQTSTASCYGVSLKMRWFSGYLLRRGLQGILVRGVTKT